MICPSDVSNSLRTTQHIARKPELLDIQNLQNVGHVFHKYAYEATELQFRVTVTIYLHGAEPFFNGECTPRETGNRNATAIFDNCYQPELNT